MAAAAANVRQQAAAREHAAPPSPATAANARPTATLDPQLFMAARRGDSEQLEGLLLGQGASVVAPQDIIVEVDPRLPHHVAAIMPPPPALVLDEDGVTIDGDSLLHVVAACGDAQEYLRCAKMIVRNKKHKQGGGAAAVRLALESRNRKGDTPLHCAAGAGNASMISCLTHLIADTADDDEAGAAVKKAFLRIRNRRGETALHQAIRAASNKVACIDRLMAMDPDLVCIPHEDGASPLYLAISLGELEIARHLFDASDGNLSYSGPDGRNVLHAAVSRGQALPMILEWLKDNDVKMTGRGMQMQEEMSSTCNLSRLTSQRDKQNKGSTPLHLAAASLEGRPPHAGFLSRRPRFSQVWWSGAEPESAAALLLDANISTAYQADDDGLYPLHVAARAGSLAVVRMLLQRCPGCATLRDGRSGRTFLHVAAEEECLAVVQYVVCGEMPQRLSSIVLNAQEEEHGDTPLHFAVRAGNIEVFNCLFRNRQVRLDMANNDGMTPLDLSWTMIPSTSAFQYAFNPRNVIRLCLLHAGAPYGGVRPEVLHERSGHMTERDVEKESEKLTGVTQVMSIVALLISTVTFASAFTLPGGYRSDGDAAGTPVLAGSYAFDAFILADTLAFICSCIATFSLVYAGVPAMDMSSRKRYFDVSAVLLHSAGRSFVAAFGLGLYLVLAPLDRGFAAAVSAILLASLLWGNMGAWLITCLANTVLARIGAPPPQVQVLLFYGQGIFSCVLVHFGSYLVIFGFPAIRKWAS